MTILKLQTGWSTSLKDKILVVVFPSIFSKNKVTSLVMNIKKILKIQNQKFHKIRRDGDVIIVEADDPVLHRQPSILCLESKVSRLQNKLPMILNQS